MNYNIIIQSLVKHDNIVHGLDTTENSPKTFILKKRLENLKDPKHEEALKIINPFIQSKFNLELDEYIFDEDWKSNIPEYIDLLIEEFEQQTTENLSDTFEGKTLRFIHEKMGIGRMVLKR